MFRPQLLDLTSVSLNINVEDGFKQLKLSLHADASDPMTMRQGRDWLEKIWGRKDAMVQMAL